MKRIIKRGTKEGVIKFNCINCGCEFEADREDYLILNSDNFSIHYKSDCPECGEIVISFKQKKSKEDL